MRQYLDVLKEIFERGTDRPNRTGIDSRALFGKTMRFRITDGFPIVTARKMPLSFIKAELLWFLSASDDINKLHEFDPRARSIWDANSEAPYWKPKERFPGYIGRIYGVQWRKWRGPDGREIDQLKNAIELIKKEPDSRRIVVTAWNPAELDEMVLPPCHALYQFFVAGNKLSLAMYQRSCDMFLGVPFNISSYSLLLCMVAQVTGLKADEFIHFLGDAHIYHNHFDQVKKLLSRDPLPLPKLWLNPDITDIDSFTMADIKLIGYKSHPAIPAPMAV
jgi:thymidylate synthase